MAQLVQYYGTGRRKTAVARVFLRPGTGEIKVNGRAFEEYFVTNAQRGAAKSPLATSETEATFNVVATVSGGGVNGQADAIVTFNTRDFGEIPAGFGVALRRPADAFEKIIL